MSLFESLLFLLPVITVTTVQGKMGYFWHITDLHWDMNYYTNGHSCWRGLSSERGEFGDHNCDSPWNLIQSAVQMMRAKNGDNIEFIFWTGDAISKVSKREQIHNLAGIKNLTTLLRNTFSSQFIFPVLGHSDPISSYKHFSALWRQWLPNEALITFNRGGYYTIEQKVKKLRLVLLNTNLWVKPTDEDDPGNQWSWLEEVLEKSKRSKETVYLVGHIAPGADERQTVPARDSLLPQHNQRYLNLVRKYADIITGQFFGHLHSDTFRIVYSTKGKPVSWMFLSPSVTPRRSQSGANNPSLRLYKFDTDTGQVQDYIQFYLDLELANQEHKADWQIEYNLTTLYGLRQITAEQLHELAGTFTDPEGYILFARYYLANSVQSSGLSIESVNQNWAHSHYCAIVNLDYRQYQNCLATVTTALAASTSIANNIESIFNVLAKRIVNIFINR